MSDAENTTREQVAWILWNAIAMETIEPEDLAFGENWFLGGSSATDAPGDDRDKWLALADAVIALIAVFPVLTTEPNETPPSNEELALAWDAACDAIAVGERHPEIAAVYRAQNAFRITQKPVLAVVPKSTDMEVMKLARTLYCADNWGVPSAGETWDEGMAFDHEYTRYERLARAAMGEVTL